MLLGVTKGDIEMKPLKNVERQLQEKLEPDGWKVMHKGWPDFACVRDGEMIFIEVKNYRGEMLKKEQHYILTNLAKLGLNCFKWTPDVGFERIMPSTPFIEIEKKKKGKKRGGRLSPEEKLAQLTPEHREEIKNLEKQGKIVYY